MKEWLKDHALEVVGIIISIGGLKGLYDFWSRICEMFESYWLEGAFVCVLSSAVAVCIALYFSRRLKRKKLAAKDAELAELRKRPTQDDVNELRLKLTAKDTEIAAFKKEKSDLAMFRKRFRDLGQDDMGLVIRVYLAGAQGLNPSDSEASSFSNGVSIKRFIRLDSVSHRLCLLDGVASMLGGCGDIVAYTVMAAAEGVVSVAEERAVVAEAKLEEYEARATRLAEDDKILHMDYLTKGLLYAIATGDKFKTRDNDPGYSSANAKNLEAFQRLCQMGLANYETCGMHESVWFGTELATKLVKEHADLFGKAKEEVDAIRKKEGANSY